MLINMVSRQLNSLLIQSCHIDFLASVFGEIWYFIFVFIIIFFFDFGQNLTELCKNGKWSQLWTSIKVCWNLHNLLLGLASQHLNFPNSWNSCKVYGHISYAGILSFHPLILLKSPKLCTFGCDCWYIIFAPNLVRIICSAFWKGNIFCFIPRLFANVWVNAWLLEHQKKC